MNCICILDLPGVKLYAQTMTTSTTYPERLVTQSDKVLRMVSILCTESDGKSATRPAIEKAANEQFVNDQEFSHPLLRGVHESIAFLIANNLVAQCAEPYPIGGYRPTALGLDRLDQL